MSTLPDRGSHETAVARTSPDRGRPRWPYHQPARFRAERPASEALERTSRQLRSLERYLAAVGRRGEAHAAANIAAELELAIADLGGIRIGSAA